ncbi:MAG: hypothetical protein ABRQ37_14710 [Candidatus Eremiobacterota bacterium]
MIIEERVDRLEELAAQTQLMLQSLSYEVSRTQIAVNNLSREMKDFKNEMNDFKDEMKRDTRNLKRELGELSKKMGTMVEDMVAPNIRFIGEKYFSCKKSDCERFTVRVYQRHSEDKSRVEEFDVIAVYPDKIILNETKSKPITEHPQEFLEKVEKFFKYFPEYKGKKIIPVYASLDIPEHILSDLTKKKIYAMAMKEDTMDLLNNGQFT